MKATRNAVLKCSPYTAALTRSLKSVDRIHCRVNDDGTIYVCCGYFLVKLNRMEYDALVRPVTQRDPGNYVVDAKNESTTADPLDMEKTLNDAAASAAHELSPAPFLVNPYTKSTKAAIATYYSASGDFVAGYNSDYAAIISGDTSRKSKDPVSPMVIYIGDEPTALVLPVRLTTDSHPSRVPDAVRAYFVSDPVPAASDESELLKRARKDADEWRESAMRMEAERNDLEKQVADLRQQLDELAARLNTQPEQSPAADITQPEQAPADKATALADKLTALDGVTVTIKGIHTAFPVVWLSGDADAHKAAVESMGGRWSAKRSAWYFKI